MAQRGDQQKTTRFNGPAEVTLRGAGSSGNDPHKIGAGSDVGFRIAIPANQTANSFQIEKPEGTIVFFIDATGTPSALKSATTAVAAAGAIPNAGGVYEITNAKATALTLAAPTEDGVTISVSSVTAYAHTITATGLLQTGSAAKNKITFAAFPGAGVTLRSFGGFWQVTSAIAVTPS
jgi:threonine dehydrogenase-like Zn-dependent dehydrogenase